MKQLTESLRYFLLALQFFTRIPVTGRLGEWVNYSPEALRKVLHISLLLAGSLVLLRH